VVLALRVVTQIQIPQSLILKQVVAAAVLAARGSTQQVGKVAMAESAHCRISLELRTTTAVAVVVVSEQVLALQVAVDKVAGELEERPELVEQVA
jgi:hypothetical protein